MTESRDYRDLEEGFAAADVPPPKDLSVPEAAQYTRYKAFVFLALGPDAYRQGDALGMPPPWNEFRLRAVQQGCRQLLEWRGFSADRPLLEVGIGGFYALMRLFHFDVVGQAAFDGGDPGKILDRMQMRHVVDGRELILFNLVDAPAREKPPGPPGAG